MRDEFPLNILRRPCGLCVFTIELSTMREASIAYRIQIQIQKEAKEKKPLNLVKMYARTLACGVCM